jgi:hypothetical protein
VIVGTTGDEWSISSNKFGTPITPMNAVLLPETTVGSLPIQPVKINNVILFVDSVGRKVREFTMGDGSKYVAADMNSLAEHITLSGITGIALQKHPDTIVWCSLDDGSAISMTYERDQGVVGWANQPIDGTVQSFCIIPSTTEDEVWLTVIRTINGTDTTYIERFAPRDFGTDIADAFFVDCGVTYSGVAINVLTGATHLVGETVSVLGTLGSTTTIYENLVVSGTGTITLPNSATVTKAQYGLAYTSKLQPMRIVVGTPQGSSQGLITNVKKMSISFLNSLNAKHGSKDTKLYDINWTDARWENSADSITGLYSGEITVSVDGGYSVQNPIIISSDSPLPCVVRSMMPRLEVTGN